MGLIRDVARLLCTFVHIFLKLKQPISHVQSKGALRAWTELDDLNRTIQTMSIFSGYNNGENSLDQLSPQGMIRGKCRTRIGFGPE
jgi:hypothetical protein